MKQKKQMEMKAETYHVPVLLDESVAGLAIHEGGVYVDATFGGGGHSREIVSRMPDSCRLYGFDQDADAERNAMCMAEGFTFVRSNFRFLRNWMRYYEVEKIDGLIADLGVSSHHFDDGERGFSFRFDTPLDMRMNRRAGLTAADVLNSYEEEALADLFFVYGEMRNARKIARSIVKTRTERPIITTADLVNAVGTLIRKEREKKELARLFQSLRIEVNHEMDALKEMLSAAAELLAVGGRLVVITYHSLEDRIVKNFIKAGNAEGRVTQDFFGRSGGPLVAVGKMIVPSEKEQTENPRSRSAKLRIAEKR